MEYNVKFEIFDENDYSGNKVKEEKDIIVEATNKKLAVLKAMSMINKIDGYTDAYKNVKSIEEVKNIG